MRPVALGIVLFLLLPLHAASSSAEPPGTLALGQAIEIALERSPLLQAAHQEVQAAEAGIDRARAEYLPKVDFVEAFTRSDNPVFAFSSKLSQGRFTQSDFAIEHLNHPDPISNFRTALSFTQPIYTGGKATIGFERARLGRAASEQTLERRRQEVAFRTVRAYDGLLLAESELGVVTAALQAAEANRDVARTRAEAGFVVTSDVLSAEVRLARLREQAIVARNSIELARARLNEVMGRPLDEPVAAVGPLAPRRRSRTDPGDLQGQALSRRPDYLRLGSEERAQERDVAAARAEWLPTVSATASYELNHLDLVANGQDSWFVGVLFRWNLFNGLGDRARVTESTARLKQSQALRAAAASQIGLEVKEAALGLKAADERMAVASEAVGQAEASLRIVKDRYDSGLTTIVNLLTAEAALTEARASLSRAIYDYNVGAAGLELALGTLSKESF